VVACLQKNVKDAVAFGALLEALFAEIVGEDTLCFADTIGAARLRIVDTFFR